LFGAFGALLLALGVIGIYGVLSFLVSRRTREIEIRLALGAQSHDLLWLVMKEGAKFSIIGIAIGMTFERTLQSVAPGSGDVSWSGERDGDRHAAALLYPGAAYDAHGFDGCTAIGIVCAPFACTPGSTANRLIH
jgi:hypothetical protein